MAYIIIDAEIDTRDVIREIPTSDLEAELHKRDTVKYKQSEADASIRIFLREVIGSDSIRDLIKMEAFIQIFQAIPEHDLDEFLTKYQ